MTTGETSELLCPRCRAELFAGEAPDVTLHGCAACGGIWLNNDDSQKALEGLSAETIEMARAAADNAKLESDRRSWAACAVCAKQMERTKVSSAGVEVDYCADHGTWFDRGELVAVSRAATGAIAAQPAPFPPAPVYIEPMVVRTSGLAIAGFICSFFCSIVGLGLSIAALNEIRRSDGHLSGEGLAIAGIAISILGMVLGCLLSLARHA